MPAFYSWVIVYNANLDRSPKQRQPLGTLRGELKKWESELTKAPTKATTVIDSDAHQVGPFLLSRR
jgi:hypothetical protein